MRVECFTRLDGEAVPVYITDTVSVKTINAEHHEVIVTVDDPNLGKKVEKMLEVFGEDRQATGPERYAAIEIFNDENIRTHRLTVTGEAYELPAITEKTYSDAELKGILSDRHVRYPKNAKTDQLMALVLDNGGLPVDEPAADPDEQAQSENNASADNGEEQKEA